jgi:lipopolysaccharide transport system permease protein
MKTIERPVDARPALHPVAPYQSLFRHGRLILELCKRDISGRYRGSMGGVFWSFVIPLLMLAIYSFVFGYIFRSRWQVAGQATTHFTVVLFVGLIISNFFSECANRAPTLVTSNPNYVKKVIFPLETLTWVAVGSALFHAAISTIALLVAMWLTSTPLAWTAVGFPLLLLLFLPMVAGITWLLSAVGVYFRDAQQIVGVMTMALVFLSPIFYSREALPEQYRWMLSINPLTFIVESSRGMILWSQVPTLQSVLAYAAVSLSVAWMGWVAFQTTRKGFADVL